jgi:NADH-quinone oxidoreductase subunit K
MIPIEYYLTLGITLFGIGLYGVLTQRNIIKILMCIEIMLNAVNINFVTYSSYLHNIDGQIFTLFIIAIAAAEVAVGLAIIVKIFRTHGSVDILKLRELKW